MCFVRELNARSTRTRGRVVDVQGHCCRLLSKAQLQLSCASINRSLHHSCRRYQPGFHCRHSRETANSGLEDHTGGLDIIIL